MANNRIVYIDIAKALCIILVVVGHYTPDGCPSWWIYIHDLIYTFRMPLFMFASGFVYIATKKEGQRYHDFIIKKVKRLMIPYIVTSAIIIGIKLLTEAHMYVEHPKTAISFVNMFYLPEAGYFLWFIWALWWMFVIVPLFKTKKQRLILFALSVIMHYVSFTMTEVFCLKEFKSMLVFFMLGVMTFDWKARLCDLKRIPAVVYLVIFLMIANWDYLNWSSGGDYLKLLLPYLGIAATISLSMMIENHGKNYKLLMTTSSTSYIIYLFHTTFEGFAKAIVLKMSYLKDVDNGIFFSIGALIVVTCGIVIPIILNEIVFKKFGITKMLFGLK